MADITVIKRMLADRVQSVAEMLLPNGRREGAEWRAGSVDGEAGASLGVHLGGGKAGVWQDFASGEGGDLIDLWSACKRISLVETIEEASRYLGLERPQPVRDPKPNYQRPPRPKCRAPEAKVRDYLVEERNIPGHVLDAFKVGENGDEIVFPFLLPNGELAMAKTRKAEAGASPRPTTANCEPILFGWQAMPATARDVVIVEGEIDALSWAAWGIPAMSVPFGGGKGGKQKWIENEFERLERFERIYLALDMDKPGDEAAEEIAGRLGRHRCLRVQMPFKDGNECRVNGLTEPDMRRCLAQAVSLDPEGLKSASAFTDDVIRLFWPRDEEHVGYGVPYVRLQGKLLFRPAEMTLWSGASGAGKSQILSDCIPHWIKYGSRICLASFEMKGSQSLRRLAKQVGGIDRPTERFIVAIMNWLDQGLLVYERVGKASVPALLDIFDYARAKYGCDQFIIDSLMRLGIAGDDYNGQEKAVYEIVDWAIRHRVHVHLVAHARKGKDGGGAPETEDVKGAMEIGANAFNILTIWRDRRLEDQIKAAGSEMERHELEQRPGVILNVSKQRNGDFEGKAPLWFDQKTYRYHSSSDPSSWGRRYLPYGILSEDAA